MYTTPDAIEFVIAVSSDADEPVVAALMFATAMDEWRVEDLFATIH